MTLLKFLAVSMMTLAPFGAQAQTTYGDRRAQADWDSRTMKARADFESALETFSSELTEKLNLRDVGITWNPRMIAQYGRGAPSAFVVVPRELARLMNDIHRARTDARALFRDWQADPALAKVTRHQLALAITALQHTREIYIDYWGYFSSEMDPKFELSKQKLHLVLHWNEPKSHYVLYSDREARIRLIRGLVKDFRP